MRLDLLAWLLPLPAAPVLAQGDAPIPPTPHDRELVLELTADDPQMIEGRGPAQVVEVVAEFEGTLHVWTTSELDLFLRVEDVSTMGLLGEDDDSGGGKTPYLRLDVNAGDRLAVFLASAPEETGALTLHLVAAPETAETRVAAASVRRVLDEFARLRAEGDLEGAPALLGPAIQRLGAVAGAETSQAIADALWDIGVAAHHVGSAVERHEAWVRARGHRERTLPEDHSELLRARSNLVVSLYGMGDLAGACALQEAVLAVRERTLPEDHPDLLRARLNLALLLAETGDFAGARALEEGVAPLELRRQSSSPACEEL